MKKIIISLIMLTLGLHAYEKYELSDDITLYNKNKITYYNQSIDLKERSDGGKNLSDTLTREEIKTYVNVDVGDSFKIASTMGYYRNGREYNKDKDLGEIWLTEDRSNIFIEKLYGQLTLAQINDWKLSFAYGIIPLTGGNFKKFSNQDEIQGNGIFTLIDLNLQGGFLILSNGESALKVGHNYWKRNNWQHDEKLIDKNSGTDGTFVFYEWQRGKHLLELDFVDANVAYMGLKMANAQMYGLGYSYDDSIDTGFIYYTTLVHSVWKSKMKDVLNADVLSSSTNSIKWANGHLPEQYDFDNDRQTGNAYLFGLKYYTEVFGHEMDVGFEYFKTSKSFSSFNNGSLFYNDYGFWRRRGTDMYTIYSDFKLTKSLTLSGKYYIANNQYTAKNGAIADTTSLPPANDFYHLEHSFMIKISYEF